MKNNDGTSVLLEIINNSNIDLINELLNYAEKFNVIIYVNEKDNNGDYPLLNVIPKETTYIDLKIQGQILDVLFTYAKMNNIILNLSDKNKDGDDFPLLRAYYNRNIDIIE
eukprot:jgi/Orpsp1_1/1177258/evm.model.c7180000060711.1